MKSPYWLSFCHIDAVRRVQILITFGNVVNFNEINVFVRHLLTKGTVLINFIALLCKSVPIKGLLIEE